MAVFSTPLCFAWSLGVAAHDFDLVCLEVVALFALELNIFNKECPNIVAEAVGL
jgi:hypothetical protein